MALDDFRHFCQIALQLVVLLLPFLQTLLQLYDYPQFLLFRNLRLCEQFALFGKGALGLSDLFLIELPLGMQVTDGSILLLQLTF